MRQKANNREKMHKKCKKNAEMADHPRYSFPQAAPGPEGDQGPAPEEPPAAKEPPSGDAEVNRILGQLARAACGVAIVPLVHRASSAESGGMGPLHLSGCESVNTFSNATDSQRTVSLCLFFAE